MIDNKQVNKILKSKKTKEVAKNVGITAIVGGIIWAVVKYLKK